MLHNSIDCREELSAQLTTYGKFIMQSVNMTEHEMLFLLREITNTTKPKLLSFYIRTQQHHGVNISFSFFLCFNPTFKNQKNINFRSALKKLCTLQIATVLLAGKGEERYM